MTEMPKGDQFAAHPLDRIAWHEPLVSIVVTHHNYSGYMADALRCILDQTYGNWECVVVDDASAPDHLARLRRILQGLPAERFKLLALDENVGQIPAFFAGLDATEGEFVCLLDPDDRYDRSFLDDMVSAHLNEAVFCPVACCDQRLLKNGAIISVVNCTQKMRFIERGIVPVPPVKHLLHFPAGDRGWHWTSTSSLMFRRAALELLRPHRPLGYKGEADSYLAQGCHLLGGTLFLTTPLVYRGVHDDNTYLARGIFATTQDKRGRHYGEDRSPQCLADAIEAIRANGGGQYLPAPKKRGAIARWRRSIAKRWRHLTRGHR